LHGTLVIRPALKMVRDASGIYQFLIGFRYGARATTFGSQPGGAVGSTAHLGFNRSNAAGPRAGPCCSIMGAGFTWSTAWALEAERCGIGAKSSNEFRERAKPKCSDSKSAFMKCLIAWSITRMAAVSPYGKLTRYLGVAPVCKKRRTVGLLYLPGDRSRPRKPHFP